MRTDGHLFEEPAPYNRSANDRVNVLEQIRSEIQHQIAECKNYHKKNYSEKDFGALIGLEVALDIVDKYS